MYTTILMNRASVIASEKSFPMFITIESPLLKLIKSPKNCLKNLTIMFGVSISLESGLASQWYITSSD
jgi:hypothetical protein